MQMPEPVLAATPRGNAYMRNGTAMVCHIVSQQSKPLHFASYSPPG